MKNFFKNKHKEYGLDVKSLGWGSVYSQRKRFEAICELINLKDEDSIIDVGSGFCDLYDYITNEKKIKITYSGVENCKPIFEESSIKFLNILKNKNNNFQIFNMDYREEAFLELFSEKFDYTICSGLFCFDDYETNNSELLTKNLKRLYDISKKGLVVNFLSKETKNEIKPGFKHFNSREISDLAQKYITSKIIISKNYMHNDFTVFMCKDNQKVSKKK